jgi:predicted tellurium resistance membrane protein TerC
MRYTYIGIAIAFALTIIAIIEMPNSLVNSIWTWLLILAVYIGTATSVINTWELTNEQVKFLDKLQKKLEEDNLKQVNL